MKQLGLFAAAPRPLAHLDADRRLAAQLPPGIFLGPSSWTFPGWEGIVYPIGIDREELVEHGLAQIARYPLFGTVGIDRSHYAPLDEATLRRYATQLPPRFPCVIKVWNAITTLVDTRTNSPSPGFLDPAVCEQHVLLPLARFFEEHTGPLVFQFAPIHARHLPHPEAFAERLDRFFGALPRAFRYAVEIRNRELLGPPYFAALARHEVSHVLNLWERMPTIGQQLALAGVLTAPFVVARLSITQDNRYEQQKKRFLPFNRIAVIEEEVRADVVSLARAARKVQKALFITVNNKVEGCSPLTIRALIERIVAEVR
jgi:uncharacterized protein YecE (DUF72 family)